MITEWSEAKLRSFIDDRSEESLIREYKAAAALGRTDHHTKEIRKDVSAFANSAGGVLIYGLTEAPEPPHPPTGLDAVDFSKISKEWLDDIITSIRPRIEGVDIVAVPAHGRRGWGYYVIVIPPSTTAHQGPSHKYYKRFNFKAEPMEDHEVRDVMNRQKVPKLEVRIKIRVGQAGRNNEVTCHLINRSAVFAEYACVEIRVPMELPGGYPRFKEGRLLTGDDKLSAWKLSTESRPGHLHLFPNGQRKFIFPFEWKELHSVGGKKPVSLSYVDYVAFADDMSPHRGRFEVKHIYEKHKLRL